MITAIHIDRRKAAMIAVAAILAPARPAASAPAAASQIQALPAELARALDAYNRATVGNDTGTLAALVTDDYMLVNSDGSVQDKASYLADFAVPGFKIDPYEVEPLIYEAHGNAALTAWAFDLGWTQEGRHQTRRLRIAHVWVKKDRRWRIAYTQLTRIPG